MAIDLNKLNNVDNNLILPASKSDSIKNRQEEDKWGDILNEQTFKTLNNNIRILKECLVEVINNVNSVNLDEVKLRLSNLETDRDTLESIVDNDTEGLINNGISERKLNLRGTELQFNGKKLELDKLDKLNDLDNLDGLKELDLEKIKNIDTENIVYKNKSNDITSSVNSFSEKLTLKKGFSAYSNSYAETFNTKNLKIENKVNLKLDDTHTNLNVLSPEMVDFQVKKLLYNGKEVMTQGDVIHDQDPSIQPTAVGNVSEFGSFELNSISSGQTYSIPFKKRYNIPPVVVFTEYNFSGGFGYSSIKNITVENFTIIGNYGSSQAVRINYIVCENKQDYNVDSLR